LINVASVAGFEGQKGQVVYSASKGAIIGMTLPMARDLGKLKIRVMTIAPGLFETPMGSGMNKKILEQLMNSTPLGRFGNSTEFALAVEAIIKNPYATGDIWRLDGGIRLPYM
jgi:NAD(P)-dependent dehydrogenase (short-subunit alcohol dehydrogenase family)